MLFAEASMVAGRVTCELADCLRPVGRSGLCWTHYNRKRYGLAISAPISDRRTKREVIVDAATALLDAIEDGAEPDIRRAYDRLIKAATRP